MNRYNSAKVSRDYLGFIGPFPAGESQSPISQWWSGNAREQNKNGMKRRLTLENKLHCLSWILSLSLICLILISLGWAAPRSINADNGEAKPPLKTGGSREENAANVRTVLEEKIRRALLTLGRVFDNVSFRLEEDDIVILSGQVRLPSLKVSAQRAARNIDGVRGVINQLEVLSASSLDGDIRREASFQFYSHSQPSHYGLRAISPIHNMVKNDRLTPEGVVPGESDKTIAGICAN